MAKRLLYITNGISDSGGLERVVSLKATYFADVYNYDVHILTLNESSKQLFYPLSKQVTIHDIDTLGNKIQFYIKYYRGVKELITQINPDVIFVADDGLKGVLFPLVFKPKSKVIYERHTTKAIHGNGIKGKLICTLMNFGSTKFDHFVVLTNRNKKDWPNVNNIEVIPNSLPFQCDSVPPIATRNKIISVGSISYFKGHDILVNAWKLIAHKFPYISLHIYGEKKDNYDNLVDLIQKNNLENSVYIHEATPNIKEKYLESVICVLPSRVEGFGMVLIEALECGTPCIASKCEGPLDILEDSITGYLFEINNHESLANFLSKMLSNTKLLSSMSLACKSSANNYCIDFIMDKWNNLIE